ncbi:hypothetical protein A7H1H_1382 [Aliarcobacter butzleri 7h1h]|uniref:hypothetical protein n=1 Tax=Aliarcobacter butzleri TaxID=28197 RepID=UPI0002D9E46F|nr:hypothetical protein [Aliarcobacter butzleri]AGR77669.1 hypothetical protein A7H1H_1382 [Aliarcobacter butzleri 7h1h]MCG3665181.1 hypothetical protein [Aliarcobacter butzleri]
MDKNNNEVEKIDLGFLRKSDLSHLEKDLKIDFNPLKKDIEELEEKIRELREDCTTAEVELINASLKLKTLGTVLKSYANDSSLPYEDIPFKVKNEIVEFIESIGLMLLDNTNTIQKFLDYRANKY